MRNAIFKKPEPTRADIDGVAVLIRPMTAGELAHVLHLHNTMKETPWKADFHMLHLCVLDTQGQPMFPTVEDAEGVDPVTAGKLLELCVTANAVGQTAAKKN